ncbi:branched-chain amino acid ABC transporter permease [Paracraurococcus lichenis]|uniref:Branched-chain amino acid ABC transporter permease n=1 Tax=Paracraurococcus lichenis TaxID=3064888 RepID=A0ABT9DZY1_9PROT|nr:branched-chain amino acid ABC transporter permease [Paracraurococcus sp. LOR1-02]MDO9709468.1 branched-chain amino acid ABC transporter permease [Paracraurococcus sp. LOR1-02]
MRLALEAAFWLLALASHWLLPTQLPLLSQVWIVALFVLSLDLLVGFAGVLTLGHAAFFGLGAYAAGILAQQGWGEPISGLLVAAVLAALLGLATAPLVLRGGDLPALMVTLGLSLMLAEAANKLPGLTGGADGLLGVEMWSILGLFRFDLFGHTAFFYSLAVLFLLFLLARLVTGSPFGLALRGIRGNARRMPAIGTPVRARLVAAYALSAAYAGVAGALLAQTTQFVSLDALSFQRSAEGLLMLVLGGLGGLYGAMLGAAAFTFAHHVLSEMSPLFWQFWIGVALVALALAGRGGLLGLGAALLRRGRA